MLAKNFMTKDIHCIDPGATIHEAAGKMKMLGVGALPVCREKKLVGILTDRDIVVRAIAEKKNPDRFRVSDLMSRHVECCW